MSIHVDLDFEKVMVELTFCEMFSKLFTLILFSMQHSSLFRHVDPEMSKVIDHRYMRLK